MSNQNQSTNPKKYFGSLNFENLTSNFQDDERAKREQSFFSGDLTDADVFLKIERFKLQKQNEDSERKLREKNAKKAYKFSVNWAMFIGFIILLHATIKNFLSQTEFMFVIGSLTASILAYYLHVIKYLFYRPKDKSENE